MLQWRARFIVLTGSLALMASALGAVWPRHFGW